MLVPLKSSPAMIILISRKSLPIDATVFTQDDTIAVYN